MFQGGNKIGAQDESAGGLDAGGIFKLLWLMQFFGLSIEASSILVIGDGERSDRFALRFATLNDFSNQFSF